ncbi:hypothetical protein [Methanobrevibacter sp.]
MFLKKIQLKNKQRAIDKQYEKEGLTDEVLNAQIELNRLRNELNIPDSTKKIHTDFVQ